MTNYQNWSGYGEQAASQSHGWQTASSSEQSTVPTASQGPAGVQQSGASAQPGPETQLQPPPTVPALDVVESTSDIVVELDAAGFEKDQIEIHADANQLYVSGDRTEGSETNPDQDEHYLLNERPVRIERTIALPVHIDPEQVTATHENGVCRIVVPKDENSRRHEIGFQ